MTLIITELSELGIVMVGDTAQTIDCLNPNHTVEERAFKGLIKVLPVQKLNAGLAYWGWTKMPPYRENGVWLDWWLQDFVNSRRNEYDTLEDLAHLLEAELRRNVPRLSDLVLEVLPTGDGGIHLAGFEEVNGALEPCFWHIHNGHSQTLPERRIDPHIVNANPDFPAHRLEQGTAYFTRNGDIEAYARFFDNHLSTYMQEIYNEQGIILPFPSLISRAEFWSAQIRFISALYEASGVVENGILKRMVKGIGDEITTLTITGDGIQSYFTR